MVARASSWITAASSAIALGHALSGGAAEGSLAGVAPNAAETAGVAPNAAEMAGVAPNAAEVEGSFAEASGGDSAGLAEVIVTSERLKLIGKASTASEGVVVNDELALTPAYRPGQLLETVPGLDVTSHSGEGKANQYLLRGYNLDHGTDLAVSVDGMPINNPTHAHGQGYTDLNFMIPELVTNIRYTKGTYYADQGDFASVGSVQLSYLDQIEPQVNLTAGNMGFQRLLGANSSQILSGRVLSALELQHYDGPWASPDDQRKVNAVIRYSTGDDRDGASLTGMFYHGLWNATTDQPERPIRAGLIGRFGTLDPSDGGRAQRGSLSAQLRQGLGDGQLDVNAYVVNTQLTLWNNFTHFLVDPVNGDQEEQSENRVIVGAGASYKLPASLMGRETDWLTGVQVRYDINDVMRLPTAVRQILPSSASPLDFSETDHVHLIDLSAYAEGTTHWYTWVRTVIGLRQDHISGIDSGTNQGTAGDSLFQPKISLILTPRPATELYLSAGRGFHSDDLRGVTHAQAGGQPGAPLIAIQKGEELGLRQQLAGGRVALTMAVFNLDAQSETTYNPDVGEDVAGPASRRYGYEINLTYQVMRWLEIYSSYSGDHARFRTDYHDGTGHVGRYLPNAPIGTGSFAAYLKNFGRWSGGLEFRYLGRQPLSADNQVQGAGYGEWNTDIRYALSSQWSLGLGLYNLLNRHANAAEFWYVDRLSGEPAGGVADIHVHPLEPLAARLTLALTF